MTSEQLNPNNTNGSKTKTPGGNDNVSHVMQVHVSQPLFDIYRKLILYQHRKLFKVKDLLSFLISQGNLYMYDFMNGKTDIRI